MEWAARGKKQMPIGVIAPTAACHSPRLTHSYCTRWANAMLVVFSRHFVTLSTAEKFEASHVPTCDLLRPQTAPPPTNTYSIHTF